MSPLGRILDGGLLAYQWTLRPLLGGNCRFVPSCSCYAREAIAGHGALRGGGLAAWRVLRCNPWCDAGYDPVPEARAVTRTRQGVATGGRLHSLGPCAAPSAGPDGQ